MKKKLVKEGKYSAKRQRLLDSDDEELSLGTDADLWLKQKTDLMDQVKQLL